MHVVEGVVRDTLQAALTKMVKGEGQRKQASIWRNHAVSQGRRNQVDETCLIFTVLCYVGPPNRNQSHQPRRFSVSCNGKCLGGFIASDCESKLRQLSEHIFCALPVMYWTDFLPVHAVEQQQFATKEEMRLASWVERKRESRGGRVSEKFQNLRPLTLSRLQRAG